MFQTELQLPTMSRTLVIGDIHGCYDELLQLVGSANLATEDRIVAVGDLVDRGPKSLDVVRFFAADRERRLAVLGNHEEKHLLHIRPDRADPSGRIVRYQFTEAEIREMEDYFGKLPLWLDLDQALVVHAGLEPGVPLERQDPKAITGRGSQGRPGWDGTSQAWYDDQRFDWPKPVIFGHLATSEVVRGSRNNVWGIDTGASVGGRLTGLLLPSFQLFSVPTPDYYSIAVEEWRDKFLLDDLPDMRWAEIASYEPTVRGSEAQSAITSAMAMLSQSAAILDREIASLREETSWHELDPAEKARASRSLRSSERVRNPWIMLAIQGLSSGSAEDILRKSFPTPRELSMIAQRPL